MKSPKVEVLPITQGATPDMNNVNRHTQRGGKLLGNSLRKRGAFRSIASAGKGVEIPVVGAGNFTLENAVDAGFTEVVNVHVTGNQLVNVVRDDVAPGTPEFYALAIEDNEIGKQSYNPDIDILASLAAGDSAILSALREEDKIFDGLIEGMGLKAETQDAEPQIDRAAELLKVWKVKTGDLWQIGEHRLICGDCTDAATVARVMDGEKGVVFADAPYGISVVTGSKVGGGGATNFGKVGGGNWVDSHTYAEIVGDDTTETAEKFYNVCKDYGFEDFILWGGNYFTAFLPPSPCWLVWDKQNTGNFADVELAWTSFEQGAKKYEWLWNGLSRKGNRKDELTSRVHPTQKPVGLTQNIMTDFPADIYFDGFGGSGTTLVACENLHRRGRAIEISPAYCAVTLQRMADAFPGIEIKRLE